MTTTPEAGNVSKYAMDKFEELLQGMTEEEKQEEFDILLAHVIERRRGNGKDINKIAPEYVDMIAETIGMTLDDALEKIAAPQEIKDMAHTLYRLESYFASIAINPECDADEIAEQWTLIGINAAVKAGGCLPTYTGPTLRRAGSLLADYELPKMLV